MAVTDDDGVTGNRQVRQLEERVRELERQLGRKTLENEILKEALAKSGAKNRPCSRGAADGRFPVKTVAKTIGVSRSNLVERPRKSAKPRRRYQKAQDGERRAPCVRVSRERSAACAAAGRRAADLRLSARHGAGEPGTGGHGRAARKPQAHLQAHENPWPSARAPFRAAPRSRPRRQGRRHALEHAFASGLEPVAPLAHCSDGFEFTCWNGEIVRAAFVIDAHNRESIA